MRRAGNYLGFVIFVASLLLAPSYGLAEIFKCKDADGSVRYADAPCVGNESTATINLQDQPLITGSIPEESARRSSTVKSQVSGQIIGPDIRLAIKDASATIFYGDDRTTIEVRLYPFKLSDEESKVAHQAVLGRGNLMSSRIMLTFPATLTGGLIKDSLIDVVYDDYYGVYERSSDRNLTKRLHVQTGGDEDAVGIEISGRLDKHWLDLSLQVPLVKKERSTKIVSTAALKQRGPGLVKTYEISGLLRYNSAPFILKKGRTLKHIITKLDTDEVVTGYGWRFNHRSGYYRITGLPSGTYEIHVGTIEKNGEMLRKPGDHGGHSRFDLRSDTTDFDIEMYGIVHLTQPIDNAITLPKSFDRGLHESPITLGWQPLPEAVQYRYTITSTSHATPESKIFINERTRYTKVVHELPPGNYKFTISAYNKDLRLGYLLMHGVDWSSSDYYFTIK